MSKDANITLNDKHLRLWGLPLAVITWVFIQMSMLFPGRWDLFWKNCLSNVLFTMALWEISRRLILAVRRRYPGVANTRKRILLNAAWIIGLNMFGQALHLWANGQIWGGELPVLTLNNWARDVGMALFYFTLIVSIYEAIYFFGQYKTALQKTEHLKKQQAQQRLDALKTRVNPHFLFNSLTTLSALIGEDASKAERFVDELSKVYRYLLRAGRHPVVTLGEELQFAESYAFLLKNRFEDGAFDVKIKSGGYFKSPPDLMEGLDQHLPALSLQNSLDYLVRTQNLPLKIELEILEKHLQINCPYQPKSLSFNASDNDWRYLENQGAKQHIETEWLLLEIPFSRNLTQHEGEPSQYHY